MFGAAGDFGQQKIFPALRRWCARGHLNVPVIGVAKAGWTLDNLKARAHDSVEKHCGLDQAAFTKLCALLRYVDGDYKDPATFAALRKQLGSAHHPAHYLAIPPVLFGVVVSSWAGRDQRRARHRRKTVRETFFARPSIASCSATFGVDDFSASTITSARPALPEHVLYASNSFLEPMSNFATSWNRE